MMLRAVELGLAWHREGWDGYAALDQVDRRRRGLRVEESHGGRRSDQRLLGFERVPGGDQEGLLGPVSRS